MEQMKRYAVYYAPEAGGFAKAAAAWLGWDAAAGRAVAQPVLNLPRGLADLTADPRKYGFHGTIKPPFRLAHGVAPGDLVSAVQELAADLDALTLPGLDLVVLEGFLAFVPQGDGAALRDLAAEVVQRLDPYRAALTEAEIARRRPERLSARQKELLALYGYPQVMEEFQFHLTLSGALAEAEQADLHAAARAHFAGLVPAPFVLRDLCLFGEDGAGRFHLIQRCPLRA